MTEAKPEPYLMSFEELVSGDHESYIQQLINEGVETDGERTPQEKKEAIKHIVFLDVAIKLATDSLGRNLAFTAPEVLESREEPIRLGLNRIKALGFTERGGTWRR